MNAPPDPPGELFDLFEDLVGVSGQVDVLDVEQGAVAQRTTLWFEPGSGSVGIDEAASDSGVAVAEAWRW